MQVFLREILPAGMEIFRKTEGSNLYMLAYELPLPPESQLPMGRHVLKFYSRKSKYQG